MREAAAFVLGWRGLVDSQLGPDRRVGAGGAFLNAPAEREGVDDVQPQPSAHTGLVGRSHARRRDALRAGDANLDPAVSVSGVEGDRAGASAVLGAVRDELCQLALGIQAVLPGACTNPVQVAV